MEEKIVEQFPILQDLRFNEFVFQPDIHISLAASIVSAELPYMPGIYIVYNYSNYILGDLLYVGMSGADKNGRINTHQIPQRLLAVCYPPKKYLNRIKSKHPTRNEAWPEMMRIDGITAIKVFCFFSPITQNFNVHASAIPVHLEQSINKILIEKNINQPWSKWYA
jgi:hypothetical protein